MRHLFSTKLKIILVLAVLITAGLSVVAGLTSQSVPDLIIQSAIAPFRAIGSSLTDAAQNIRHGLMAREGLGSTSAVKKARVYLLSESLLQTPTTRLAAAVYLASSMYPDLFSDIDAAEAARQLIDEAGLPSTGIFFYP